MDVRLAALTLAALCASGQALAQTSVAFGRITAVNAVSQQNANAQIGGAILGGTIGAAAGSGRSGSNRALGGIGGAFAGQQIGRLATQRQAYEYTILVGDATTRMITDEAGLRVGDCVAVERGAYNNLRLVADAKCAPPAPPRGTSPPPATTQPSASEIKAANACIQAKEQLLVAETEEAFDRAERRVRLLCAN